MGPVPARGPHAPGLFPAQPARPPAAAPPGPGLDRALAGFLAGILGGSTANGPPIIVYAAMQPWTKDEAKSLMTGYFFFAGLAVISLHALSGLTTLLVLRHFVTGLPALAAGEAFLGSTLYRRLGDRVPHGRSPAPPGPGRVHRSSALWLSRASFFLQCF